MTAPTTTATTKAQSAAVGATPVQHTCQMTMVVDAELRRALRAAIWSLASVSEDWLEGDNAQDAIAISEVRNARWAANVLSTRFGVQQTHPYAVPYRPKPADGECCGGEDDYSL